MHTPGIQWRLDGSYGYMQAPYLRKRDIPANSSVHCAVNRHSMSRKLAIQKRRDSAHLTSNIRSDPSATRMNVSCESMGENPEPISHSVSEPHCFCGLGPDGKFTLSAGFSSANKDLLRKLWDKSYRTIQIHSRKGLQGSASIESLLKNGEMGFIDLSEPIIKQSHAKLVAVTEEGTFSQASLLNKAWEETLDWFGNPACTGALFECGAGTSGQKVLAGDCVEAGKEYLLAIKDTGW